MAKRIPRSVVLSILFLILTLAAIPPAAAQSSSPGRYRSQGQYRSEGGYRGSGQAWKPSYHHQNKYFQVQPLPSPIAPPFTGSLSRSNLLTNPDSGGYGFNFVTPTPVFPGAGTYVPYAYAPAPPPPPAAAPAPQVYVIQPQPAQQAPPPAAPPRAAEPPPPAAPVSNEPGELALSIRPADARIYLNDRFVGTGQSLAEKGEPLVVKPGVYVLAAEHPDFTSQRLVFGVTPEETTRVAIDLTADRPGRRARVESDDGEGFVLN